MVALLLVGVRLPAGRCGAVTAASFFVLYVLAVFARVLLLASRLDSRDVDTARGILGCYAQFKRKVGRFPTVDCADESAILETVPGLLK